MKKTGQRSFAKLLNYAALGSGVVLGLFLFWALVSFEVLSPGAALLAAIITISSLAILAKMTLLGRQTAELRKATDGMSAFEADISRRMAEMEQGVSTGTQLNINAVSRQLEEMRHQLADMQTRLNNLEQTAGAGISQIGKDGKDGAADFDDPNDHTGTVRGSALSRINLKEALDTDALNLHLQPIVTLPERKPVHYEALMRLKLKNGKYLDANQFIRVAEKGSLMPVIDRKVLFSVVRMLRTLEGLNKQAGLFCNLSEASLTESHGFREVLQFLQGNVALKSSLVFEISQRGYRNLTKKAHERLMAISDLGFDLSLDQVLDLRLDIADLSDSGIRYIKVPAGVLLHAKINEPGYVRPSMLSTALEEKGMQLIASEIDREADVMPLLDFGVTQAQGLFFAPPRPVRADLLKAKAATEDSAAA